MEYSIGKFEFLALYGRPDVLRQQIEIAVRPGVDGVAIWKTGRRGKPFTLRSAVDANSIGHAQQLFYQYAQLIGADPVPLVFADMASVNDDVLVAVLDVRPITIRAIAGGVGGLNGPSYGWCECDWDLVPVQRATS